jgi:hypothetical protein
VQTPLPYSIHPIASVLAQIAHDGADPWVAIGNFLHDWWCYGKEHRHDLIAEPPSLPDIHLQPQWAAFCAASVEEVCRRTSFPCPDWVDDPIFVLAEPWRLPSAPDEDNDSGLPAFQRRNILVGSNVLDNKYELQERYPHVTHRYLSWTDQEIQHMVQNSD